MKPEQIIKIAKIVLILLFIIALYFLLPYILSVVGVNSFVIITGSMSHPKDDQGFFESFWKEKGFEPGELSFRHGINKGDLVIVTLAKDYGIGDVILGETFKTRVKFVHRIYEYNSTHFRDTGDLCITEEESRIVTLAVKGVNMMAFSDDEDFDEEKYDKVYKGPRFEICGHYWMPVSQIKGKARMVFPKAGLLYNLIK